MSDTINISDSRYLMDLAAVDAIQTAEKRSQLIAKLRLNPLESKPNYRQFKAGLIEAANDGGESEYVAKALLDDGFYENLSRLVRILKSNEWRPAYIRSKDIELFKAFETSVTLFRKHSETTVEG